MKSFILYLLLLLSGGLLAFIDASPTSVSDSSHVMIEEIGKSFTAYTMTPGTDVVVYHSIEYPWFTAINQFVFTAVYVTETTTISVTETTTISVTETTTISVTEATTISVTETTTISVIKTTTISVTETTHRLNTTTEFVSTTHKFRERNPITAIDR